MRGEQMDTGTANILIGLASLEARQSEFKAHLESADEREGERVRTLAERIDERHNTLVNRLEERHVARERWETRLDARLDAVLARLEKLDALEAKVEAMRGLPDRVQQLEALKGRTIAMATAASGATVTIGGVAAWLWDHLGAKLPWMALGLFTAGCAPEPVNPGDAHWCLQERPAHVVASDLLGEPCLQAIDEAVAFWSAHGADYLTFAIVGDEDLTPGRPHPRFIQVTSDLPESVSASGDARLARITPECLVGAELRFDPSWCTPSKNTAAHELGHALGLLHHPDPGNLMYPVAVGGYGLDSEQLEHIR